MTTLEERLEDEEYKLWVKAGVCIAAVKKGLEEFARTRSQRAHTQVKTALNNNPAINNVCQLANIQFNRRLNKWSLGCCTDCQIYVDELENLKYPPFTFKLSNWNNTDIKQWPKEPWEMMKVFMNPGQLAAQKDSSESDLSAILNFITHCRIPRVDIYDQNNISKVREARNEIMHSAQMKISLGDFQKHTKAMIDLLEDQIFLYQLQDAKDAVKIIQEVQGASFCITRSDEVKALKEKTTAITARNITLTAEIAELRSEQENIRAYVKSGSKQLETLIEKETDDRQEALDKLTKEIELKDTALKKLSDEISFVNRRINQDNALYRKMDIRVRTVEKTLKKTDKEFQGFKKEHFDIKNDLEEIKGRLHMKTGSDLENDSTKDYQILKHVSKEQEHEIETLQLELTEKQTRYEEDVDILRTRIKELEQQNETYSRHKETNSYNQEAKEEDKDLVHRLRCENKELTLAYEKLNDSFKSLKEGTVQDTQTKLKEATEMNDALQYNISVLKGEIENMKSKSENNPTYALLQEYEDRNIQQENEIDRLRHVLRESDRDLKETQNMLKTNHSEINKEIKDRINTEEALRSLSHDVAQILSEAVQKLADIQNQIRHTIYYDEYWSQLEDRADEEIQTLIQSLFSTRRTLTGDTLWKTNVDKLKQLITEMIIDLKEKFDREHQHINTAETSLKTSQKTNEELSKKIEELQNQIQTEKNTMEALDERYKLSALDAETARKDIYDLKEKLDREHQVRNTAEKSLKSSQKTNEELSKMIEELQNQVQTEKNTIEALDERYKLSALDVETARKDITDMQQKFEEENQLRNTAETNLKASQKTIEELSLKIEDLQKQVQTEKKNIEALEEQHKLTASVASETAQKDRSDLQQNFDQENQLRNTAETNLKASQKTNKELSIKIEDLQKQVQTDKISIEALEQYKLSASVASETARKDISDLQQKFDEENQLRNTAEMNLKASLKTNEELSLKIEDLQKQVQTEKKNIEALEEQYKLSASVASETAQKDISDMKVVSSRTVDVKRKDERGSPSIKGCVFLSTGQLVLCDWGNNKIKLLRSDLKVEDSLDLQRRPPYDISAVSSSTVIITLPGEQQLQYIELTPRLQLGRVIKLDKKCWGVCVFGEEIYVTCYTRGEDEGEVRILDYNGSVKRRLGVSSEHHSSYMFSWPEYVSVSTVTGRIYVTDRDRRTLTCLSKEGSIIYQYSDPELITPRGLYLDVADNVIVCDYVSNNLLIISPRGEKVSTLLSEKDGIENPCSVAYRSSDETLVVNCLRDKKFHVFKLSH